MDRQQEIAEIYNAYLDRRCHGSLDSMARRTKLSIATLRNIKNGIVSFNSWYKLYLSELFIPPNLLNDKVRYKVSEYLEQLKRMGLPVVTAPCGVYAWKENIICRHRLQCYWGIDTLNLKEPLCYYALNLEDRGEFPYTYDEETLSRHLYTINKIKAYDKISDREKLKSEYYYRKV